MTGVKQTPSNQIGCQECEAKGSLKLLWSIPVLAIGTAIAAYMLKSDHLQKSDSLLFLAILGGLRDQSVMEAHVTLSAFLKYSFY